MTETEGFDRDSRLQLARLRPRLGLEALRPRLETENLCTKKHVKTDQFTLKEVQSGTKSPFHIWACSLFIALQIDRCRQHLVTKSGMLWSHDDSAMAEHLLYWG